MSEYIFHLDRTNKKIDHITYHALMNTKASEQFFSKFDHCALTFKFLKMKERDIYFSHEFKLKTKFTHAYIYSKII